MLKSDIDDLRHENDLSRVSLEEQIKGVWDHVHAWGNTRVEVSSEVSERDEQVGPPHVFSDLSKMLQTALRTLEEDEEETVTVRPTLPVQVCLKPPGTPSSFATAFTTPVVPPTDNPRSERESMSAVTGVCCV